MVRDKSGQTYFILISLYLLFLQFAEREEFDNRLKQLERITSPIMMGLDLSENIIEASEEFFCDPPSKCNRSSHILNVHDRHLCRFFD